MKKPECATCNLNECPVHPSRGESPEKTKVLQEVFDFIQAIESAQAQVEPQRLALPPAKKAKKAMQTQAQETYDDEDGKKRKFKFTADNVSIERRGKKIILPEGMSFQEAGIWIDRKQEEDSMVVSLNEVIEGYPLDAAYAFTRAMSEIYGWTGMVPTPSFWGPKPPDMMGLQIGPKTEETVQVPWGRFVVPNISGYMQSAVTIKNGWPHFTIGGEVKNRDKEECARIAHRARDILRTDSIYRGKAIRVSFPEDLEDFDIKNCPTFLDTSESKPDELIFSDELMGEIQANLFAPIRFTAKCREKDIPLKRGVLLHGPYGTGKTLTANVAAYLCVKHGWTFLYLDNTEDLPNAIRMAKLYQPAMIFAEDIDRAMEDDDEYRRDAKIQKILNTIDGVDTKNTEIVVALTTNFVARITQAMLRPGRLDAVIEVTPPDADAVQRLIRLFGRELIAADAPLDTVGAQLKGQIPAVVREVVERSKLFALAQTGDCDNLTDAHLTATAKGMLSHLKLLEGKEEDRRNPYEKATQPIADALVKVAEMNLSAGSKNGHSKDQPTT